MLACCVGVDGSRRGVVAAPTTARRDGTGRRFTSIAPHGDDVFRGYAAQPVIDVLRVDIHRWRYQFGGGAYDCAPVYLVNPVGGSGMHSSDSGRVTAKSVSAVRKAVDLGWRA